MGVNMSIQDGEGDVFVKITNRDIYKRIEASAAQNAKDHREMIEQQKITNGQVRINKWVARSALAIATFLSGSLIVSRGFW